MTESFTLEIDLKGQRKVYAAELRVFGYTHKILVQIDGHEVIFEPDEERNYRVLLVDGEAVQETIDRELLQIIALELEASFK